MHLQNWPISPFKVTDEPIGSVQSDGTPKLTRNVCHLLAHLDFRPGPDYSRKKIHSYAWPPFCSLCKHPVHIDCIRSLRLVFDSVEIRVRSVLTTWPGYWSILISLRPPLCTTTRVSRVLACRGTEPIPFFIPFPRLIFPFLRAEERKETCEPHPHVCGLRLGKRPFALSRFSFLGRASYHQYLLLLSVYALQS
jgi:hypothetical protein